MVTFPQRAAGRGTPLGGLAKKKMGRVGGNEIKGNACS
jgi:hypothetical protein